MELGVGGVYGGVPPFIPFLAVLGGVYGGVPPFIPFLTVHKDGQVERVFTNRSLQYSTQPFTSMEIVCEAESDEEEDVNYFWNMLDIDLSKADKDFEISNGTLRFLSSNYGMFECFASNSQGTSYSAIILTKHEADVANPLKLRQGPEHLKVSENSFVKFCCEVEGGRPAEFSWTFNTAAVDASWKIETLSDHKQIMVVDGVEKVGTVGCLVTQNGEKVYQEGSIVLSSDPTLGRMIAPDINLEIGTKLSLLEGSSLNLTCQASGSPEPALVWSHQSESVGKPFLFLEDLSSDMSGEYRCTARNAAGRADKSTILSVFSKSVILSSGNQKTHKFLIFEHIQLTCMFTVDARLRSETVVEWSRSGGSSLENINTLIESTSESSTLTINNLTMSDAETYSCRVTTPLDSVSEDWVVDIVYPPTILNLEPSKIVLLGSLAVLSCETNGSPAPTVTWLHNNSVVPSSDLEESGRLVLDRVDLHQAGEYTCRAHNQYGTEQKTFSLAVAQPTTPIIGNSFFAIFISKQLILVNV